MIFKATLVAMDARPNPALPPVIATLSDDEANFLERHVSELLLRADAADGQFAKFHAGSNLAAMLRRLLKANDDQFAKSAETLVLKLKGTMAISTNPKPGVFVIAVTGDATAERVTLLKLDADIEVAQWEKLTAGGVKLSVLKGCLPGPGSLQKGISWPDPRTPSSDVIVQDRNVTNALYFLNAFDVDVSPKASDIEKALHREIVKLPPAEMKKALRTAAAKAGPVDTIVAELKAEHPTLELDKPVFGAGGVAGQIRPNKLASQRISLGANGIKITLPFEKVDALTEPRVVGDHWEVTVSFPSEPQWAP